MNPMRFLMCVLSLFAIAFFVGCDKSGPSEQKQLGEIGVYCVLEPDMSFNQKVILKRLPVLGEPEIYTSISGAQVKIINRSEVYEFRETMVQGIYRADFKPELGQQYTLNIVTPEGDEVNSTISIPEAVKIRNSNAVDIQNSSWYGPLNNALYPGFVVSAENVNEDYYIVVKGQSVYPGKLAADTLKYWS